MTVTELHAQVSAGDKITIVNRFGQTSTGRVVMRNAYGFVLNMGGKHGTPGIATPENIVKITKASEKVRANSVLF
jgi:hypothetical protein